MRCACTGGNGLDIQLCDFHARVFHARNNRLVAIGAQILRSARANTYVTGAEIQELDEALQKNGVSQLFNAGAESKRKAHALLIRAYDALTWCSGADDFQRGRKAYKGWQKDIAPLLEELRKIFNPKEKASNG